MPGEKNVPADALSKANLLVIKNKIVIVGNNKI